MGTSARLVVGASRECVADVVRSVPAVMAAVRAIVVKKDLNILLRGGSWCGF